jgi:uncharacterized protein (TIGR02996 family)
LLETVCESPYDETARLAYATWLESLTPPDPQGEFIRLALRVSKERLEDAADAAAWRATRERWQRWYELEQRHGAVWKAPALAIASEAELDLGLVAGVTIPAERFVTRGAELFHLAPIVHVKLIEARAHMVALAKCEHLSRVRSLDVARQGLGDEEILLLARSPGVANLWALDLTGAEMSEDVALAMATSPFLSGLRYVAMSGGPGNPIERVGYDMSGQGVEYAFFSPDGKRFEEQLGRRVEWLHVPESWYGCYPPSRLRQPPA